MSPALALRAAARTLTEAGIPGAMQDARRLLAHVLDLAPERLSIDMPSQLDAAQQAAFEAAITRRAAHTPVSHITGQRLFYGRRFAVSPDVLDPRPETEELVAEALEQPFASVLDLGTGSGCILLTLLAERPRARGLGVDLSETALAVARRNAEALEVAQRVTLRPSDWFQAVEGRFELIVSNPPYIAEAEMTALSPEVLREPRMALTPGGDGLAPYRVIAAEAARHLVPGGRLLTEIGWQQGPAVVALFHAAGLENVRIRGDMDGRDRVVCAEAPQPGTT
ncbi:peptide chain release factor N(5)-glutamine methyltransferase [Pseudooceanicola sp. CBS1P-1]|uniref:Release factor glutamine methyltransferase n=1 Tax=Pseudooceanicola albus TaxID=2692189 RepID=A0A6L7FYX3_9RHOB|nr:MULTISPECIES: peptide chain release factor N(5)-glutamine methyltransferase [Pseudooceanicola]MBT9383219.1 peptide chain release factor N(5)-glutamine methyltransferase [Pseudooceanicola endophyticus]MXN16458.1 peptide chain release factor N(5)-glutamine methyltransferase [Pseudooceanicola albus]